MHRKRVFASGDTNGGGARECGPPERDERNEREERGTQRRNATRTGYLARVRAVDPCVDDVDRAEAAKVDVFKLARQIVGRIGHVDV